MLIVEVTKREDGVKAVVRNGCEQTSAGANELEGQVHEGDRCVDYKGPKTRIVPQLDPVSIQFHQTSSNFKK